MLAEFVSVLLCRDDLVRLLRQLPDPEQRALAALVARRRQWLSILLSERQWLQLGMAVVRPDIEAMIAAIRQPLDDVEAQLVSHVQMHFNDQERTCARPAASARWPARH